MSASSPWIYLSSPFDQSLKEDSEYFGFVYIITNTITKNFYVGKKLFWFKGRKTVTLKNGTKKKKRCLVESDWKEYYGSSSHLADDIKKYGKESFVREILYLCTTKAECTYLEAYEQFTRHVLLDDSAANAWIMCRVRKEHLRKVRERMIKLLNLEKPGHGE